MSAGCRPPGRMWLVAVAVAVAGCVPAGGDALVIATTWTRAEREAIEADFRSWLESRADSDRTGSSLTWLALATGVELEPIARGMAADVLLGGSASEYRRMAGSGRLVEIEREGRPRWCISRRSKVGLALPIGGLGSETVPAGWPDLGERSARGRIALGDPRRDAVSLALAEGRLGAGPWADGYAELVRTAGNARRITRSEGAALADLERGEAAVAPATLLDGARSPRLGVVEPSDSPAWLEGVGIVRGSAHAEQAERFLEFLGERGMADAPGSGGEPSPAAESLLADLLGATLVDAQDELRSAWGALLRDDRPARWEGWMIQSPPWPPASVVTIAYSRRRRGDDPAPWLETLAGQLAPEPLARAWLIASWDRPQRPIDGALLEALAGAADGRLVAEPRFRSWLRAEWTAWARQRYRRVGRMAGEPPP